MELIANAFPALLVLGGFMLLLGVGGIIADYGLKHIKPLERFFRNLPMNWM